MRALILCTLANASTLINDIPFVDHPQGKISADPVDDETAAVFASIPGYHIVDSDGGPSQAELDAAATKEREETEARERAEREAKEAAEKAAEKEAAEKEAAEEAAAKEAAEKEAAEKAAADEAAEKAAKEATPPAETTAAPAPKGKGGSSKGSK